MADVLSAQNTDANDIHFETIKSAVPPWLIDAPPETRRALRKASLHAPQWLDNARDTQPEALKRLHQTHALHRFNEQQLNQLLARLPGPEDFATPLLTAAIEERFGLTLDVRSTYLFHARRVKADTSFLSVSGDPVERAKIATQAATQPLLRAALQNFEAWEAEPGGMDASRSLKSVIYQPSSTLGVSVVDSVVEIAPEQFADLCRSLDLGGKYQALIREVIYPASAPGDAADAAAANVRGQFKLFEESAFALQVRIARLKGLIPPGAQQAMLDLTKTRSTVYLDGQVIVCSFLRLWEIDLTGIVVISKDRRASQQTEKIFVYIPDDPFHPLKEYDSTLHFIKELRDRLLQPGYQQFFMRFVPARQRNWLLNKLNQIFNPKVWNSERGWYEYVRDEQAKLNVSETTFSEPLLTALYQQKVAALQDDGLFHAVPTAVEDHKSLEDKLRYFADTALQVLNVAAFVVPVLGEIMLAVTAAQLLYETYEGIEAMSLGEKEQAWGYFLDVAENLALMAALGGATAAGGGIPAVQAPELVKQMRPVQLPDASFKLWKPDVTAFAHDIVLPAGLRPNSLGLYDYQGRQWLSLEGKTYAVKPPVDAQPYRLQHPRRANAYEPVLRHNHAGAWLHEADHPLDWQGLTLFRRLGQSSAQFSDVSARRILQISDTHEAVLRRTLAQNEQPPALLDDTMQRFQLDQQLAEQIAHGDDAARQKRNLLFRTRYQALQTTDSADIAWLQRVYPELPRPIAEEVLRHATPAELQQLQASQRLPMRLAEEIRVYQQQLRLTRAYEGLYLESVHNPDTDRLILHSLENLPGWSAEVRLEVRNGSFNGALLDSIGPTDAPIRKVLIKDAGTYQARDIDDLHLHGRDNLYAAVMHALPDAQRYALGLPHVGQGADLQSAVQNLPLMSRQALADLLSMPRRRPGSRSPMRLADGRLGYPLSGRGATSGYIVRETLLDKLRMLELTEPAEDILRALENRGLDRAAINQRLDQLLSEHQILRNTLDRWAQSTAEQPPASAAQALSRQQIGSAIWEHWQSSNLPEIGRGAGHLRLNDVSLADFPPQLPTFISERVQALQLDDVTLGGGHILGDYEALGRFFRRFPQTTSLSLGRSTLASSAQPLVFNLPDLIAQSFTGLQDLRLRNQGILLTQTEINAFRRLPQLQVLDLSGNRLGISQPTDMNGLNLRYLSLERMDLTQWPSWLDRQLPGHIAEVSLDNNRLTDLPDHILSNMRTSEFHSRISLRGNVLSRGTLIRARLGESGTHGRYSFDLEVPTIVQDHIDELLRQRQELQDTIDNWVEASSSTAPLSEARIRARRQIGDMLQSYWRDVSEERGLGILDLENIDLGDFPRSLPEFFYQRVIFMELEAVAATPMQLNQFLRRFPRLIDLTFRGHITPMARPPQGLLELPNLQTLRLIDQGMVVDQPAMDFFARLPSLDHLELDGNTLGSITDVSGLANRRLQWLGMNNVGLSSWPQWLSDLMSSSMETLNLEDNNISELPEAILRNPRSGDGHTEIGLHGNPLTHETMRRAHTSESYGHAYSFAMDLPEDILRMEYQSSSGSDSSTDSSPSWGASSPQHAHSPSMPTTLEPDDIEPWLIGAVEEEPQRRITWQQLESSSEATDLLRLVSRLRFTADYRTLRNRSEMISRVWRVLAAAAQDTELRLTLNGMSEEPLRLLQDYNTCPDGIRLEFNQMEVLIYTREALVNTPKGQRGQSLYRLTRRLYRLHELDRIAREQAGSRDEAEVRLAYRLRWASELDLPLPPGSMLYRTHARLEPGELDNALGQVRQGEHSEPFMAYAAQRDFWVEYLREAYAGRFRELKEAYEASVLEVTDLYPEDNSDQMAARITALEEQFERDEQNLIRELTNREGLDQS